MVASVKSPEKLTLEQFLQLPETKPASEYFENKVYQKPMPQGEHSAIQSGLLSAIYKAGEPKKLAMTLIELRCIFGGSALVPDIAVFEWQRIPRQPNGRIQNKFEIAPDWVIEIVSPDQFSSILIRKILFCLNHGTQLGWLVDPQDESVITFQPNQQPEVRYNSDPLPVLNVLTDWQFSAKDLFSCLY